MLCSASCAVLCCAALRCAALRCAVLCWCQSPFQPSIGQSQTIPKEAFPPTEAFFTTISPTYVSCNRTHAYVQLVQLGTVQESECCCVRQALAAASRALRSSG
jgi:hypothetical protein